MYIINHARRLITLNFDGKSYPLMPAGDAVEVPDDLVKKSDFAKSLIKDRSIAIHSEEGQKSLIGDNDGEGELEQLREEAGLLGIEFDGRWGIAKLTKAITEAQESNDGEEAE
jgi:hypothetical protein